MASHINEQQRNELIDLFDMSFLVFDKLSRVHSNEPAMILDTAKTPLSINYNNLSIMDRLRKANKANNEDAVEAPEDAEASIVKILDNIIRAQFPSNSDHEEEEKK